VRFHLTRVVSEFRGGAGGALSGVLLDNGTLLPATLVVMGAGVIPATSCFKQGVQKERDGSIVVDEYLRAAEDVFCGGDIARYPYHRTNGSLVRIEHFGMAMFHGKTAALNMLDRKVKVECANVAFLALLICVSSAKAFPSSGPLHTANRCATAATPSSTRTFSLTDRWTSSNLWPITHLKARFWPPLPFHATPWWRWWRS
jgi:hypothetical protein